MNILKRKTGLVRGLQLKSPLIRVIFAVISPVLFASMMGLVACAPEGGSEPSAPPVEIAPPQPSDLPPAPSSTPPPPHVSPKPPPLEPPHPLPNSWPVHPQPLPQVYEELDEDFESMGPDPFAHGHSKNTKDVLIDHKYYSVKFSPEHRLARYVRYVLKADHLRLRRAVRKDIFRLDGLLIDIKIVPVMPYAYAQSGYERGHLAPSADFLWSQRANDESFVMSNISPQAPALNVGSWYSLESKVRRWACAEERLIVFAGPILESNLPKLKSGVSVPRKFFKVILDDTPPRKAIGFVFSQDEKKNILSKIKMSPYKIGKLIKEDLRAEFPTHDRALFKEAPDLEQWNEAYCGEYH